MYNLVKLSYKSLTEKKISYSYGGIDVLVNYIFKEKKKDSTSMLAVVTQLKIIIHTYCIKKVGVELMLT